MRNSPEQKHKRGPYSALTAILLCITTLEYETHSVTIKSCENWLDALLFQSFFSLRLCEGTEFIIYVDKPKTETDAASYTIVSEF